MSRGPGAWGSSPHPNGQPHAVQKPIYEDDEDELAAAEEDYVEDDLEELEAKRRKNDQRFKGYLERIFEKYEHDFTGIGDEIDVLTGKVVINNGHLETMQNEVDPGSTGASSQFLSRFRDDLVDEETTPDEHDDDDDNARGDSREESFTSDVEEIMDSDRDADEEEGEEEVVERAEKRKKDGVLFSPSAARRAFNALVRPAPRLAHLLVDKEEQESIQRARAPPSRTPRGGIAATEDDDAENQPERRRKSTSKQKPHISPLKHGDLDADAIQALGMSIASGIMSMMSGAPAKKRKRSPQRPKVREAAWEYPEPGETPPRKRRPPPRSSLSYLRHETPGADSLWASGNERRARRTTETVMERRTNATPLERQSHVEEAGHTTDETPSERAPRPAPVARLQHATTTERPLFASLNDRQSNSTAPSRPQQELQTARRTNATPRERQVQSGTTERHTHGRPTGNNTQAASVQPIDAWKTPTPARRLDLTNSSAPAEEIVYETTDDEDSTLPFTTHVWSSNPHADSSVRFATPIIDYEAQQRKKWRYSKEEADLMIKLRKQGLGWEEIATHFPGRARQSLENYWQRCLKPDHLSAKKVPRPPQKEIPLIRKALHRRSLPNLRSDAPHASLQHNETLDQSRPQPQQTIVATHAANTSRRVVESPSINSRDMQVGMHRDFHDSGPTPNEDFEDGYLTHESAAQYDAPEDPAYRTQQMVSPPRLVQTGDGPYYIHPSRSRMPQDTWTDRMLQDQASIDAQLNSNLLEASASLHQTENGHGFQRQSKDETSQGELAIDPLLTGGLGDAVSTPSPDDPLPVVHAPQRDANEARLPVSNPKHSLWPADTNTNLRESVGRYGDLSRMRGTASVFRIKPPLVNPVQPSSGNVSLEDMSTRSLIVSAYEAYNKVPLTIADMFEHIEALYPDISERKRGWKANVANTLTRLPEFSRIGGGLWQYTDDHMGGSTTKFRVTTQSDLSSKISWKQKDTPVSKEPTRIDLTFLDDGTDRPREHLGSSERSRTDGVAHRPAHGGLRHSLPSGNGEARPKAKARLSHPGDSSIRQPLLDYSMNHSPVAPERTSRQSTRNEVRDSSDGTTIANGNQSLATSPLNSSLFVTDEATPAQDDHRVSKTYVQPQTGPKTVSRVHSAPMPTTSRQTGTASVQPTQFIMDPTAGDMSAFEKGDDSLFANMTQFSSIRRFVNYEPGSSTPTYSAPAPRVQRASIPSGPAPVAQMVSRPTHLVESRVEDVTKSSRHEPEQQSTTQRPAIRAFIDLSEETSSAVAPKQPDRRQTEATAKAATPVPSVPSLPAESSRPSDGPRSADKSGRLDKPGKLSRPVKNTNDASVGTPSPAVTLASRTKENGPAARPIPIQHSESNVEATQVTASSKQPKKAAEKPTSNKSPSVTTPLPRGKLSEQGLETTRVSSLPSSGSERRTTALAKSSPVTVSDPTRSTRSQSKSSPATSVVSSAKRTPLVKGRPKKVRHSDIAEQNGRRVVMTNVRDIDDSEDDLA